MTEQDADDFKDMAFAFVSAKLDMEIAQEAERRLFSEEDNSDWSLKQMVTSLNPAEPLSVEEQTKTAINNFQEL